MADTEVLAWAGGVAAVLAAGTLLIGLAQRSVRARPWLLILFVMAGGAAGILNVYRLFSPGRR